MLTTKQQLLLDDVESLRARLKDFDDESAALRKEVDAPHGHLTAPHAVQQRMAKMLRRAVDEVSEMQAEAQAEAEALIAEAQAEAEADAAKAQRTIGGPWPQQRETLESRVCESQGKARGRIDRMSAELSRHRALTGRQEEREQLLADAKQEADHYREQSREATEEAISSESGSWSS